LIECKFEKVIKNIAKCLYCGDVIESKSKWDYQECSCKSLSVDGGCEYLKRSYTSIDMFQELSEIVYDETRAQTSRTFKEALRHLIVQCTLCNDVLKPDLSSHQRYLFCECLATSIRWRSDYVYKIKSKHYKILPKKDV